MDVSKPSHLQRLIDFRGSTQDARIDFELAMQDLKITSVFDIVRRSKEQFIRECVLYNASDAERIYHRACNHARQVGRLYQQRQISSDSAKGRERRSSAAGSTSPVTYQNLFKENWKQFCEEGDVAAIDSPVAYLNALYLFAGQLENTSIQPDRITLDKRRPDIQTLLMDHQSAFVAQPMLNIVNNVLSKNIETYLSNQAERTGLHQALASAHYPFSLPYDIHHQQCLAGLGVDKPALGALNYLISPALPFSPDKIQYGYIGKSRLRAQEMLCGLSPEQQKILLKPLATDTDHAALKKAFGVSQLAGLEEVKTFKSKAGLTNDQLDQLLARGKHSPCQSRHETNPAATYATAYINGDSSGTRLTITKGKDGELLLSDGSKPRLDRLQRMIRLQRWVAIPFAELDTLIVNAMRSEGNVSRVLNQNTLRTLGVYRYLAQRYPIAPEEFAAFLHDMPTQACGERTPLFDQVFNHSAIFINSLQASSSRSLDNVDASSQVIYSQLSAGLALTQDELMALIQQTRTCFPTLKQDLPSISSLYRQARIARMFGLSPRECTSLAKLIGGETFYTLLVHGTLSATPAANIDILDVLMALDWAVEWFKHTRHDVPSIQRVLDPAPGDWTFDQSLQDRLSAIAHQADADAAQQVRLLENFLYEMTEVPASHLPCVLKLAGTTHAQVWQNLKSPVSDGAMPDWLLDILRAAIACRDLQLSGRTLTRLLDKPEWLASGNTPTLTLQNVYLLESVSHWVHTRGQSEESLLHFLQLAHQTEQNLSPAELDQMLARLLDWTADQVTVLINASDARDVMSMAVLDWVMRCQACCNATGVSAATLIKACALTSDSPATDWHTVGAALIAARH